MAEKKTKQTKKKFYAIKEGNGVKDKIVTSWDECSKLVLGYNAVYKSFKTEEEAKAYLGVVNVEHIKELTQKCIEVKKKKKVSTKALSARIDKEIYDEFIKKCEEMNLDKDNVIKSLIEEWVI